MVAPQQLLILRRLIFMICTVTIFSDMISEYEGVSVSLQWGERLLESADERQKEIEERQKDGA